MVSEEGRCDSGLQGQSGAGRRRKRSYEAARRSESSSASWHPRRPKSRRRKEPGESLKQIAIMMKLSDGQLNGNSRYSYADEQEDREEHPGPPDPHHVGEVHHGPETRASNAGRHEHLEEVYNRDGNVDVGEEDVFGGGAGGGATYIFRVSLH